MLRESSFLFCHMPSTAVATMMNSGIITMEATVLSATVWQA